MCCINNTDALDWGTWAAIASALAAVCSLVITIIIAISQRTREKQAQKISLFEKRHEIYKSARRIYDIFKFINLNNSNYFIVDRIVNEYNLLGEKDYMLERRTYKREDYENFSDDLKKINQLNLKTYVELYHLRNKLLSEFETSKYLFNNDIAEILFSYVNCLFDFSLAVVSEEKKDTDSLRKKLIESSERVNNENLFDKMESFLYITK